MALVAFTIFLFLADIDAETFAPLGYLGVCLANLIGSAAVIAQSSHSALARKTHMPRRLQRLNKRWWPLLIFLLATILGRSIKGYILAKAGSLFFI